MTYALNEIEALAKRAGRGAGLSWGLAEEASKAARWLCANGIDGAWVLSALLVELDGRPERFESPKPPTASEIAPDDDTSSLLCPLRTGTIVADFAWKLEAGPFAFRNLAFPVLVVPFMAVAALHLGRSVSLESVAGAATTDGVRLSLSGDGLLQSSIADVVVRADGVLGPSLPTRSRVLPDSNALQTLGAFAHRTYAPATEESRRAGAGAGLSDND